MEMIDIARTLQQDSPMVVFANVLLQQLGLPVPAVPALLLAGSLAASPLALSKVCLLAVAASVVADLAWYAAGRRFGYRILAGLCKLSINPASCVSQTEAKFTRWGIWSLLAAKFVPGFSTVAPPIAGAVQMPLLRFIVAAAAGAGLWAGVGLGAGWMMRGAAPQLIAALEHHGATVAACALALAVLWLAWKLWQKHRFHQHSAMAQIAADELLIAMQSDRPPLLLDLRSAMLIDELGPIAGAVAAEYDRLHMAVGAWPKSEPIVTLCACPEDAGAILAAKQLHDLGYLSVRPLAGGYEALQLALATVAQ